jgi:hypothetical protein
MNVALKGMAPVMTREGGGGGGVVMGDRVVRAEMERECPLPPIKKLATTTDPVVKVSWVRKTMG